MRRGRGRSCVAQSDLCRLKPTVLMTDGEIAGVLDGIAAMLEIGRHELMLPPEATRAAANMAADLRFIADGLATGKLRYERIFSTPDC